jgi:lipopolysaccharide transport system ATP-binding protein
MGSIKVTQLGKAYKQYPTRWSRLAEWLLPFARPRHRLHWVLRDISFEVKPGEAVGLIGANGAGKSTLLKLITGTSKASEGAVEFQGRVAALLELGMGFHPEFTGRQNVIMAAQLLGLNLVEIQALMPEIEVFAEIGEAIDQPLRTYSSGMQMRLAFSVATARRPDILIVDEALSVGDAYFQHKSFERIRQFRREGTTLLIVSHDRYAIQSICDRALLLHDGVLALQGKPDTVLDYYHALMADREGKTIRQEMLSSGHVQTVSGTAEAVIAGVRLLNTEGRVLEVVEVGSAVVLEVQVQVQQPIEQLVLGFLIKDRFGQAMYGINTQRMAQVLESLQAGELLTYRFAFPVLLGQAHYSVSLSLSSQDSHLDKNYEWRDYGLVFHVVNTSRENFVGCSWLDAQISIDRPEKSQATIGSSVGVQ